MGKAKEGSSETKEIKVKVQVTKNRMYLRQAVASGETEEGKKFEVVMINMHTPAVDYDGKMFIFNLQDLVQSCVESEK